MKVLSVLAAFVLVLPLAYTLLMLQESCIQGEVKDVDGRTILVGQKELEFRGAYMCGSQQLTAWDLASLITTGAEVSVCYEQDGRISSISWEGRTCRREEHES